MTIVRDKISPKQLLFLLFGALLLALCLFSACASAKAAEQDNAAESRVSAEVLVHGEHASLWLAEDASSRKVRQRQLNMLYQAEEGSNSSIVSYICGEMANQGLCLYALDAGIYSFLLDDLPLISENFAPLSGYTLPRNGIRKHWQFATQNDFLQLVISDIPASEGLPNGLCDIYIDVGHGGLDPGSTAFGYMESEENLKSSLSMRELLEAAGFVVQLSREDNEIPGGETAENNPYLPGARVDGIYQSGASYLISNHLNGGSGYNSGYQIYTSVLCDTAWAKAIAAAWDDIGWHHNNSNSGLVENGIYKRWTRDNMHTNRDYYFILRETGGLSLTPARYKIYNDEMAQALRRGPEGMLLEYLFLDNYQDILYWDANHETLIAAALSGCYEYWQLDLPAGSQMDLPVTVPKVTTLPKEATKNALLPRKIYMSSEDNN